MRIAYLVNQYPKVSHSFIRREILALERRGFDVMRIALRGWDGELVDSEDIAERARTRYVLRDGAAALLLAALRMLVTRPRRLLRAIGLAWRTGRRAERPLPFHFIYLAEASRIVSWLDAHDVQHLHAHFGTNSAQVAMLVHALGGPRWSFTVHGPEEFDKPQLLYLAEKVRDAAFVVAISSYGRSQLYRLVEHRHWAKIHIVHCGLDAAFLDAPATPVPDVPRLVCVGRLCEQKGQLLLLEAASRLATEGRAFKLVLAGDGELRPDVEALIARDRLENFVRITGWISSDQVREEILAARALVLPSFAEGLPVVIMEAMALRRPVISTYVAGIPELVCSNEYGWLVPAGDVGALADTMRASLDASTSHLTSMGKAAYVRVRERHSVDSQVEKLGTLLSITQRASHVEPRCPTAKPLQPHQSTQQRIPPTHNL
jgi:glycosyltransferase involved in cell wall biosynthesis